jgi:hypothetical protein
LKRQTDTFKISRVAIALLLSLSCYCVFPQINAQVTDTKKEHSPKRATIYSAVLPGLGQAYNQKYWKIPIVYAVFGTLYYFIHTNGKEYRQFRDAFNIVASGDTLNFPTNSYIIRYNANLDQLRAGRNYYRRNLELSYIITGALYILQIIDANVDAHLHDFDISDDLSLSIEPYFPDQPLYAIKPVAGISIKLKL